MYNLLNGWHVSDLPNSMLPIALICAVAGAVILTRFMPSGHFWTLPLNIVWLLLGALAANVVLVRLLMPLNFYYQRPLVSSLIGITVASLVILVITAWRGQDD